MTDVFGSTDPRFMPLWFFHGMLSVDYSTAIRANIAVQNYSVCPRHWYIDARFRCGACGNEYQWLATEQKVWFESYRFYVDAYPTCCRGCRAQRRYATQLRQEYDTVVHAARAGGTTGQKQRIVEIVNELEVVWASAAGTLHAAEIPDQMRETRDVFRKQLAERCS